MRKIKEVLRLKFSVGLGLRAIAEYLQRAEAAGVTWPLGEDWDEGRLETVLFGGPPRARPAVLPMPDFADLHQQRQRHPHVTQQLLWEEYRQARMAIATPVSVSCTNVGAADSGIAPVREASGRREWVHAKWACPKFLKQTFQEWAQHSMTRCAWARKHYDSQRASGKGHRASVRSLAFKWIRILFRCWQARTRYDETRYTESLCRRSALPNTDVQITWKNVAGFLKPTAFSA